MREIMTRRMNGSDTIHEVFLNGEYIGMMAWNEPTHTWKYGFNGLLMDAEDSVEATNALVRRHEYFKQQSGSSGVNG